MAGTAYNGVPTFAIAALPQPPNKAPQSNAFAKTPRPLNEKTDKVQKPPWIAGGNPSWVFCFERRTQALSVITWTKSETWSKYSRDREQRCADLPYWQFVWSPRKTPQSNAFAKNVQKIIELDVFLVSECRGSRSVSGISHTGSIPTAWTFLFNWKIWSATKTPHRRKPGWPPEFFVSPGQPSLLPGAGRGWPYNFLFITKVSV